jgi:ferredoxin-NADP reductase
MIEEFAPQAKEEEAVFYIAGPPGMVSEMHKMLNTAGINDDDIRFEEFTGY